MDFSTLQHYRSQGNIYETVMQIAESAERFRLENDNLVSESDALSFIIDGKIPKYLKLKKFYKDMKIDTAYKYASDICKFVEDDVVRESVLLSVEISEKYKHIVYKYADTELGITEYQKSRIRVLVNSIWYEFQSYKRNEELF